jgi:hypothetical protein
VLLLATLDPHFATVREFSMAQAPLRFCSPSAKARLLPSAAQILLSSQTTQQTFLSVFAHARFPVGLSQAEEQREERLRLFNFYNDATGKDKIKAI